MALRATILAAVETAFKAAQDLVVNVTLVQESSPAYDFANQDAETTDPTSSTIEGILFTAAKDQFRDDKSTNKAIVRSRDVREVSVFDTLTANGKTYNITSYTDNDFIIEFELVGA